MSAKTASCPQCGKNFFVASPGDWVYRDGSIYYCSWKCIREHDAKIPPHPDTNAPKPVPIPPEQLEKFEKEDKRIRRKLQRQCPVKTSEETQKKKRQLRKRTTEEEKKQLILDAQRLINEQSMSYADASRAVGVAPSTMDNWLKLYREELGIEKVQYADRGRHRWDLHPETPRKPSKPNLSGKKTARIVGLMARIRASLTEIGEEVASYGS